jgi:hypothetical protein
VKVKVQCPFKLVKYRCEYGSVCIQDMQENDGMPSFSNECSVAIRQREGHPWRNERIVVFDKKKGKFKPKEGVSDRK